MVITMVNAIQSPLCNGNFLRFNVAPTFSPQDLIDALAITRFTFLHLFGENSITLTLGEGGDQGLGGKCRYSSSISLLFLTHAL